MTAIDKWPLITKSVTVTQIDIHHIGEEPDQHVVRTASRASCTTIVCEIPTKSWLPTIVRPSRHPKLPHSPFNKPPWSREVQFDKVVTGLLGLPGPIKLDMRSVQIKTCHWGQNNVVLNRHRQGLPFSNPGIAMVLSPSLPSEWSTFP
jgi:hypothetical protein